MKKITHTIETGRSMIEMLGVLAIVGILSVGALTGYSQAMIANKINKHTSDIIELVQGIKEAYENENSYDNLDKNIAQNLGLMNSDGSTKHIKDSDLIQIRGDQYNGTNFIRIAYSPEKNDSLCFKLLLSRWYEQFGNDLVYVGVCGTYNGEFDTDWNCWDLYGNEDLPLSTSNIKLLCDFGVYLSFAIK